jgi:hypothetical protein
MKSGRLTLIVTQSWIGLFLALLLTGCGSFSVQQRISDREIKGIAVQIPQAYKAFVIVQEKGERVVTQTEIVLPREDRLLDIDMKAGFWSTKSLNLTLHPNGGLKKAEFSTESQASENLDAFAGALDTWVAAQEKIAGIEKANAPANELDTENTELKRQLLNAMLQANLQAVAEGKPLPFPQLLLN